MTDSSTSSTPAPPPDPARPPMGKVRRWVHRIGMVIALLMLTVGVMMWVVTRSWFIIGRVAPELSKRLGGEVTISNAVYMGADRFEFENMILRSPTLKGEGGELVRLGQVSVSVDLPRLLLGQVRLKDVKVGDAQVRLSEDRRRSGEFNFMTLVPKWSPSDTQHEPPTVTIDNAVVEYGVHEGGTFRGEGLRRVSGLVKPADDAPGWFYFQLGEIDERGGGSPREGVLVHGMWNFATNEHWSTTTGLQLDPRTFVMCPQVVQAAWKAMNLEGRVSSVYTQWSPNTPFSVTLTVDDVGLTLPLDAKQFWARYRDGQFEPAASQPRLHVRSGSIKLSNEAIELQKLAGNLLGSSEAPDTGVPYLINVRIAPLPPMDWDNKEQWAELALRTAPFDVSFRIDDFMVKRDEQGRMPALDLPVVVAKALAKFQLTDWSLSSTVQVTRGEPVKDASGQLVGAEPVTDGQAFITNATGRYAKFPYLMENINAHLTFDSHRIDVDYVKGTGSGGAPIHLSGSIAPPDNDAKISLRLIGTKVPVDERLRDALDAEEREMYDAVFARAALQSLTDAGLLVSPDDVKSLEELRTALNAELTVLKEAQAAGEAVDEARMNDLSRQAATLQRQVQAGAFTLGGTVDLKLSIERPYGDKMRTTTTGEISFDSIGIIYDRFPYPVRIERGAVEWKEGSIEIKTSEGTPGLVVSTSGDGEGLITGGFDLKTIDGKRRWLPRLSVVATGDAINEFLYTAIPPAGDEAGHGEGEGGAWPGGRLSQAARLLRGVGLSGTLDYAGAVSSDPQGHVTYDLDVTLADATAQPTAELAGAIGAAGLLWPDDYVLRNVNAQLKVRHDGVRLNNFSGQYGVGQVTASGTVDLSGGEAESAIDVHYEDFELGPYVANFAPAQRVEKARAMWDLYQPDGVINADLTFRVKQGRAEASQVQVYPKDLSVLVGGRRVNIRHQGGDMSLRGGQIEFRNLGMELSSEDRKSDGVLVIHGGYDFAAEDQPLKLHGEWTNGALESPLIAEAIRLFGAPDAVDELLSYKPAGLFDASFDIDYAGGDAKPMYAITSRPRSLSVQIRGTPVYADIESGTVTFRPERIEIDDVVGRHAGGVFGIDGVATTTGAIDAHLTMTYDGRLISNQVLALLPDEARQALTAIEFADGSPSRLEDCTLHLTEIPVEGGASQWRTDFRGVVRTSGASFTTGVRFTEVDGAFEVDAKHDPGRPVQLTLAADVSHMKTLGQSLRDARWSLALSESGDEVVVPEFRALAGGGEPAESPWDRQELHGTGTLAGQAVFGVGERKDYRVMVDLAGVPLSGFVSEKEGEGLDEAEPGGAEPPESDSAGSAGHGTKRPPTGEVFASIALQGRRDEVSSRTGRGTIRIIRGRMANVPLVLQLAQMMQLTAPIRGTLDFADVSWFLEGDRVVFERIVFESTLFNNAMLQLIGEGEMQFSTTELNTRFRSRSGIALIRDIVGGLGDAFYEIEVTGTLREPKARLVPPEKDSP